MAELQKKGKNICREKNYLTKKRDNKRQGERRKMLIRVEKRKLSSPSPFSAKTPENREEEYWGEEGGSIPIIYGGIFIQSSGGGGGKRRLHVEREAKEQATFCNGIGEKEKRACLF